MKDIIEILNVSEADEHGMVTLDIQFNDDEFYDKIVKLADEQNITLEEFIVEALTNFLEKVTNDGIQT